MARHLLIETQIIRRAGWIFIGNAEIDTIWRLMDIAANLDFIVSATARNTPTSICRHLRRPTY